MSSLYELNSELSYLIDLAQEPDTDPQLLADTWEAIAGETETKIVNCGFAIRNIDADISAIDAEINRLTTLKNARENAKNYLKEQMLKTLQLLDVKKFESSTIKVIRKKNGGKAPLVITGEVPQNCMKIVYEVDKTLIRKKLEAGEELRFAHIGERGEHLEVK